MSPYARFHLAENGSFSWAIFYNSFEFIWDYLLTATMTDKHNVNAEKFARLIVAYVGRAILGPSWCYH